MAHVGEQILLDSSRLEGFKSDTFAAPIVRWMEESGVLEFGRVSPSVVTLKTRLLQPIKCASCDSRLDIKSTLKISGWTATDSGREASLKEKCFYQGAPLEYFVLLKHHLPNLLQYDDTYGLRHTQSKAYFDSILVFFQNYPGDTGFEMSESFGGLSN